MRAPEQTEKESWDLVIKPKTGWLDLHLNDLYRYRDLVMLFVRRDFVSFYKQTVLGPLWFLLQPLLTTVLFVVIFGRIAKLSADGLPHTLFYFSGIILWNYFSECLVKTSNTFINNAQIFGKVYFPRLTVPVSIVLSNMITFFVQFIFFLILLVWFYFQGVKLEPNIYVAFFPVLLLIMGGLGLGFGIIVSSLTTKYRDLRFLVDFGVKLLMYATPVIFPLASLKGNYKIMILANPMTPVIEAFRYGFTGYGIFEWHYLGYSFGFMVAVLLVGVILFNKVEKNFMDTV